MGFCPVGFCPDTLWKLNGKIVGNYFVTLSYHTTSQKKIGPRSYMTLCSANQVVGFCLYDEY